jgi:hypothetical protein
MLERLVDAAAVEAEIERVQSLSGDALRHRGLSNAQIGQRRRRRQPTFPPRGSADRARVVSVRAWDRRAESTPEAKRGELLTLRWLAWEPWQRS